MLIATKETLLLTATTVLIVGAYGFNLLREERLALAAEMERETRLIGAAVEASVGNAMRDEQITDVQSTLADLEAIDSTMDIYIFDAAGKLVLQSENNPPGERFVPLALDAIRSDRSKLVLDSLDDEHPKGVLALPVSTGRAEILDGLVVVRSLEGMRQDLDATRRGVLVSMTLLILAIAALQYALGLKYVTRPLAALASSMRRLRSRESTVSPSKDSGDEVGQLTREFEALVEDLRLARERIDREVESRTNLEHGLQRVDKLITIGQLSAGLAHEIGSPLQVLSGRARAILARPGVPDEIRRHAQILADQSDRITRIVEQLLDFSRRRPPRFAKTDLRAPVGSVLELIAFAAQKKSVSVEMHAESGLPDVVVDADQIQQMILNLLNNALEATEPGGRIAIRLSRREFERVGDDRTVPGVRIVVEDDGRGIPKEMLDRMFQPFFTTRIGKGGTGLGLAVVKAIVVAHRGRIAAFSELGVGSRFEIDIPLVDASPDVIDAIDGVRT